MQCTRCNTPLVDGAGFCGVCGQPVAAQAQVHDDRTIVDPILPRAAAQATQQAQMTQQPPSPAAPAWAPTQAVVLPPVQPQAGAAWPSNQPQGAYPYPYAPGSPGAAAPALAAKKRKKWPWIVLSVFLALLIILAGGWFLILRPYLHNLATTQLNQALSETQSELTIVAQTFPSGSSQVPLTEATLNSYLQAHSGGQLQNLHGTITPDHIQLDFSVNGFGCTIIAVPIAVNGELQVINVQTQGVLGLVLSGDELSGILNTSLHTMGTQLHRHIDGVKLHNREMDLLIS